MTVPRFTQITSGDGDVLFALDVEGQVWQYNWAYVESGGKAGWMMLSRAILQPT